MYHHFLVGRGLKYYLASCFSGVFYHLNTYIHPFQLWLYAVADEILLIQLDEPEHYGPDGIV